MKVLLLLMNTFHDPLMDQSAKNLINLPCVQSFNLYFFVKISWWPLCEFRDIPKSHLTNNMAFRHVSKH